MSAEIGLKLFLQLTAGAKPLPQSGGKAVSPDTLTIEPNMVLPS